MPLNQHIRKIYTQAISPALRRRVEILVRGPYPRVFDRKRFIFIHIPKTAGKSVARALGSGGAIHLLYRDYESILGDRIAGYDCFSVVRNPYDRLISAYAYMVQGGNQSIEDIRFADTHVRPAGSLESFIRQAFTSSAVQGIGKFRPQTDFLRTLDGDIADVDILYFENLDEDFRRVAARIGVNPVLQKTNKSTRSGLDLSLGEEALAIVNEIYADDFSVLGYERQ